MPGATMARPTSRRAIAPAAPWPLPKLADPTAPLLVVEDLTTHFKLDGGTVRAVDGVSASRLDDGEALGIAGESGCGKTTTALSLVRLLPANAPDRQRQRQAASASTSSTKTENALRRYRWREISIVFQGAMNALNPVRRIGDQIAEPIEERLGGRQQGGAASGPASCSSSSGSRKRGHGVPARAVGRDAPAGDDRDGPRLRPGDRHRRRADDGPRRDGPGPDPRAARATSAHELGLSLILITHDLSVIAETCDRVLVMYAGRVAEEGPVDEVFRRAAPPVHPEAARAFPNIHADRRTLDVIPGSPPDLREPPPGCRFAPRCPFAMDGLHARSCRRR